MTVNTADEWLDLNPTAALNRWFSVCSESTSYGGSAGRIQQ